MPLRKDRRKILRLFKGIRHKTQFCPLLRNFPTHILPSEMLSWEQTTFHGRDPRAWSCRIVMGSAISPITLCHRIETKPRHELSPAFVWLEKPKWPIVMHRPFPWPPSSLAFVHRFLLLQVWPCLQHPVERCWNASYELSFPAQVSSPFLEIPMISFHTPSAVHTARRPAEPKWKMPCEAGVSNLCSDNTTFISRLSFSCTSKVEQGTIFICMYLMIHSFPRH